MNQQAVPVRIERTIPFLILLVLITVAPPRATAAIHHLLLAPDTDPPSGQYTGSIEVTVAPPFKNARVSVTIDGQQVARNLQSPYRLEVNFGSIPVEHVIEITARSYDGSARKSWTHVLNQGLRSLAVELRMASPGVYEAIVAAPTGDPVTSVEFYDGDGLIRSLQRAPYLLRVEPHRINGVLRVTARTRSGSEAMDLIQGDTRIHAESYDVRTVDLLVSLLNSRGSARARLDLGPSVFEVLDNGQKTKILSVSPALEQPISVAVVVDSSASMTYELDGAAQAAAEFVRRTIRAQDRCAVFSIQSVPRRVQALTGNQEMVQQALQSLEANGETALYDSIRAAVRELRDQNERRAIVLLTDGSDTSSISDYDEILELLKVTGIPMYVIAFNESDDFAADRDRLAYLTGQSGGFLSSASKNDLAKRYEEIEQDLRGQYAIRYQITDFAKPNEWRDVEVRVREKDLTARTIRGYYVP